VSRRTGVHPVTAERIARQGFVTRPTATVPAAARLTTAIQAQDPLQSRLGLRSRGTGFTESDVLAATADRAVVRTWLMRATIHLVEASDARWLTAILGPSFARRYRKRWLDIGLTPELLERTARALPEVLAEGPLTKAATVERLRSRKVTFPMDDPQAAVHVLMHATGLGLLCRGPDQGREATFTLLDQWLPHPTGGTLDLAGDDALAELARRYFAAFAPATAADFATWSGLPSSRAVALIRDELEPLDIEGRPGFRLAGDPVEPAPPGTVALLAGFDNYLIGYKDRSLFIGDRERHRVYVGGIIKPTVVADGRVVGIWRLARTAKACSVTMTPLEALPRATVDAVEAEVVDIGRFLRRSVTLEVERAAD
jgi:hypothetical protein